MQPAQSRVLVLLGHPDAGGLCGALTAAYASGARQAGHHVEELRLGELAFDPVLHHGYRSGQPLEPDLMRAQELLTWCSHLTVVFPVWWGSMPALLKGFWDRTLLPGFAFRYHASGLGWDRLLSGRSAHVVATMDAPAWYYSWIQHAAADRSVRDATLGFCGFTSRRTTRVGSARHLSATARKRWLDRLSAAGALAR